ncbi:hypothetical protein DFJ73DRAFT_964501 [Zopfochytrium polystomum]|nr:hypothetical protein DFJ73DRAFT_964501 [Zopfochytrium polystomum]
MGLGDDFRSGNFTIYGQWSAIISIILMIVIGISVFLGMFPFAVLSFVFAFVMILLELPIITSCCPCTGPRTESFVKFFANPIFKSLLYASFAVLLWLSVLMSGSAVVISAIALSVTTVLYGIASFRRDEASGNSVLGALGGSRGGRKGAAGAASGVIKKSASTGASVV